MGKEVFAAQVLLELSLGCKLQPILRGNTQDLRNGTKTQPFAKKFRWCMPGVVLDTHDQLVKDSCFRVSHHYFTSLCTSLTIEKMEELCSLFSTRRHLSVKHADHETETSMQRSYRVYPQLHSRNLSFLIRVSHAAELKLLTGTELPTPGEPRPLLPSRLQHPSQNKTMCIS